MDDNMIYYLFICIFIPLLVSVPLIRKPSRDIMIYLIAGIFIALFVSDPDLIIPFLFHFLRRGDFTDIPVIHLPACHPAQHALWYCTCP